MTAITAAVEPILAVRWKPSKDLAVVAFSWALVGAALYSATVLGGTKVWDGMAYFFLYAVAGATLCGPGIPLFQSLRPLPDTNTKANFNLQLLNAYSQGLWHR